MPTPVAQQKCRGEGHVANAASRPCVLRRQRGRRGVRRQRLALCCASLEPDHRSVSVHASDVLPFLLMSFPHPHVTVLMEVSYFSPAPSILILARFSGNVEDLALVQDYECVQGVHARSRRRNKDLDGIHPDVPACQYIYLSDTFQWRPTEDILSREIVIPSVQGLHGPGRATLVSGQGRAKAFRVALIVTKSH